MEQPDGAAAGAAGAVLRVQQQSADSLRVELSQWFGVPVHTFEGFSHAMLRDLVAELRDTPSHWGGVRGQAGRDEATLDLGHPVQVRGR